MKRIADAETATMDVAPVQIPVEVPDHVNAYLAEASEQREQAQTQPKEQHQGLFERTKYQLPTGVQRLADTTGRARSGLPKASVSTQKTPGTTNTTGFQKVMLSIATDGLRDPQKKQPNSASPRTSRATPPTVRFVSGDATHTIRDRDTPLTAARALNSQPRNPRLRPAVAIVSPTI